MATNEEFAQCAAIATARGINFARIVQATIAMTQVLNAMQLGDNETCSVALSLYLAASTQAVRVDEDLEVFRAVTKAVLARFEFMGAAATVEEFRARVAGSADPLAAFKNMPAAKVG